MRKCGMVFSVLVMLCALGCNGQPTTVSQAAVQEA